MTVILCMKSYKIIVRSATDVYHLEIDKFFDDPMMEACTRIVEMKRSIQKSLSLPPFMIVRLDRKNSKEKIYNSYIILVNCGLHKQAENLRLKYKKNSGVDLREEPMCSK